jgi:predicted heme/steroid binding protein
VPCYGDCGSVNERLFTLDELRLYNGRNGSPAYLACNGIVYDVTGSFLWQNGKHEVTHQAGEDLTGGLDSAPHGEDLLWKFPVVGFLRDSQG